MASPPTPTMTWFFTIIGAMVVKYCSFSSATFLRQRSLPSLALSEMNQPSGLRKYSQSPYMPTPRLPTRWPPVILPAVMPEFFAGARVDRPDVVGNGEVEDPVDHQRRRFDLRIADAALRADVADAVEPVERQAIDVRLVICASGLKRRPE